MILSNKDYENILDFSCNIGKNSLNFYQDSLNLISKHFNYTALAFFPETLNITSVNDINKVYFTNFYSINLDNDFIKEFKEYYHKVSIFQPLNLPENLLNNSIISIDDIMPYSSFIHTENSHFLNKYNFHYRLNINLYSDNTKLGTLCIFKTEEEGKFTEKELKISEILSNILSINYNNFLTLSNSLFKQNILEKCYDSYTDGIIIWDSKQYVLESNNKAEEFCYEIAENINISNDFIYISLIGINQTINPLKKIISYLSLDLIQNNNNKNINITTNNHIYTIKTSVIITLGLTSNMETTYFTCITKSSNNEACSLNKTKIFYNLTDRELEVVNLIKKGYSNNEISAKLYLSGNTVKTHITNIFKKLDVNNRTSLLNKITITHKEMC